MKINLTKKQYETLAKLVYMGNWVANATRTGTEKDPHLDEYENIADYFYSFAQGFGLPDSYESEIEFSDDPEDESEAQKIINHYDNDSFWEELPDRLGQRDFHRMYSKEDIEEMDQEEHFLKSMDCNIKWEKELEKNGIERLGIVEK